MATVPLRADTEHRWAQAARPRPPRLVMVDDDTRAKPARAHTRRRGRPQWDSVLFAAAAAAVLLFCLWGAVVSLYRSVAASYRSPLARTASVPVTVHPGDSLWTYAQKYGAPDVYILDRVDAIARANHLTADAPLVPGQHLTVPVTNPTLLARLEHRRLLASN